MPKRTDIKKILIIGAGPIVIGQACEFDYSGVQACKALREEGYAVVLLNSNPATIMTDPEMAERTYIEPITLEMLEAVLRRERPDAILPTLGGQTALNLAVEAHEAGLLEKYCVEMIGATAEVIHRAEDRDAFKEIVSAAGVEVLRSEVSHDMNEARRIQADLGLPIVIRPSFTLGGSGGSVAYNIEEFEAQAAAGMEISPVHSVLLEESVIGWKEFELEVMRDRKNNAVIICSIENLDPMGVHTGDSITVAPAQTLSDREYQAMRDAALTIIREIGVETGGCNIQFAVHPKTGRMVAIEMNPRVSRSSALASKATGFPIAKFAAKVAVGMTLDEIANDITRQTPACFEPTIDYCVVKIPRFTFEKFPTADDLLTVSMKSVGEVMAIGRTFKEAFQKALRGLEIKRAGLGADGRDEPADNIDPAVIRQKLTKPNSDRLFYIRLAIQQGMSIAEIAELTRIDPWFLDNIAQIVAAENGLFGKSKISDDKLLDAKKLGFSDAQLGRLTGTDELAVRERRKKSGIRAVFKLVDTCGGEFEAYTPYYYSTYEREDETRRSDKPGVMILGGGPNRIGQGLEFDYCCVHAAEALREMSIPSIMVNCNPETVSTDYDTSDRLYFEPLTLEDVLEIVHREQPRGLIVQFGGQTPLNLSEGLAAANVPILGTNPASIARAEDRRQFSRMCSRLSLRQPRNGMASSVAEALALAGEIGYPVIVRPSFVLGGRAMEIVYTDEDLRHFVSAALKASDGAAVLIDKFLEDAIELDVDAVADGTDVFIAGIMEHIEYAGVHSGDAAMALPPHLLNEQVADEIRRATRDLAEELDVRGLMNIQFAAVGGRELYILEVNPRASRTVPFVSKVTGVPIAKVATRIMLGETLASMGLDKSRPPLKHVGVKESVFPFNRFPGTDAVLGPEMKSTGEVMGIDSDFGLAYAKSQIAAGTVLPKSGTVFVSIKDADKQNLLPTIRRLKAMGFDLLATDGTSEFLDRHRVANERINKVLQGRPHVVDAIKNGKIDLIINTPSGRRPRADEQAIRINAVVAGIPLITTATAAEAVAEGIAALRAGTPDVRPIQEHIEGMW
ncbi:MAG: carbamoyl-phosphate synthase large subunit [Planctomycetota bacterium]|nr:carbamoyl-phosphate synthase large subunit [Planctomycetota bacterium]